MNKFILFFVFFSFPFFVKAQKTTFFVVNFSQNGPHFAYNLKLILNNVVIFDDSVHWDINIPITVKEGRNVLEIKEEYPFWRWIVPYDLNALTNYEFFRINGDPSSFINKGRIIFNDDSVKKYCYIDGKEKKIPKKLNGRKQSELTTFFSIHYNKIEFRDEPHLYK